MKLRVVTYNVLSSHLSSPSHYTTLNPEHLDPLKRLPVVLNKLERQLEEEKRSIFCLQEVSYDWAGTFHTFFAQRGFHMVTGLYGRKFNGYMGVALAFPTDQFEVIDVNISRLSDTRSWPPRDEKPVWASIIDAAVSFPLKLLGMKGKDERDPWEYSEYRLNVMTTVTLKDRASGDAFCIGTYHMPCAYFAPQVMTIHADMCFRHIQDLASRENVPCIVAGDFNIKPADSCYTFLTKGRIDKTDPCYPVPKNGVEWTPTSVPMESACVAYGSKEPDFTNYARVKEDDPFIDTLDYIFLSKGQWQVEHMTSFVDREQAGGPFPNLEKSEPSDHILMAADLICRNERSED